jgi:hypothetical protein
MRNVLEPPPYGLTWAFAVELRGFEPLTPCMPSQSHRQTEPHRASPDPTSHQVGGEVDSLAVLSRVGLHGPVADTLLTTDRTQNAAGSDNAVLIIAGPTPVLLCATSIYALCGLATRFALTVPAILAIRPEMAPRRVALPERLIRRFPPSLRSHSSFTTSFSWIVDH